MPKLCRFCHTGKLALLYAPTKQNKSKNSTEFTCTNCGFGIHGPIVKCPHCHIIYVDEKIAQAQISTYYEVAQDPQYFKEQPARNKTFLRHLEKITKFAPQRGKILDIGTNTGLFIRLALDDEWGAIGIEPNRWAVEYAKKNYGVILIAKPFTKKAFPRQSFDAITMWDVIEHFTNPVSEISTVYSLLKPTGIFVFTTVDPESILARVMRTRWPWYMEMHRVFLTKACAKFYLKKAGFKKIVFRSHIRYLSAGYLATRLLAINATLAKIVGRLLTWLRLEKAIVPYYANDLYDCYAFK